MKINNTSADTRPAIVIEGVKYQWSPGQTVTFPSTVLESDIMAAIQPYPYLVVISADAPESTNYGGAGSFQVVATDLSVEPGVGSNTSGDPKFIAPIMGNLIGSSLTKAANYLGGLIGAFSVLGAKASSYPVGAILAIIMDSVTEADGAVVAVIDGDSGVTTANAAFKAMGNNSNAGSGFNYGLDLHCPAHDGFNALAIKKADLRLSDEICHLHGAGVPVDGTTGLGFAGPCSQYADITNFNVYINAGPKSAPVWKLITRAV